MTVTFTNLQGFATLQDHGRPGLAHLAIPTAGAFDVVSHNLANRLVGNAHVCASIEFLRANCEFVATRDIDIAVTGAPVDVRVDNRILEMNSHIHVPTGSTVSVKSVNLGMRTYLAIRGGFELEEILGSQSFDELAKIGNPPLAPGQSLNVGNNVVHEIPHDYTVVPGISLQDSVTLRAHKGPRWDFFNANDFLNAKFTISSKCNRVGVRLEGTSLSWDTEQRLASEGVAYGAIQVPVDGVPLIFGPDHPTTAGYPVIAVVSADDMAKVAQLAPGTHVQFSVH